MAKVNDDYLDSLVRHQILVQRWGSAFAAKRALPLLNAADVDLVQRIAQRLEAIERRGFDPGPATTKRLQRLLAEIRSLSADLRIALGKEFRDGFDELAPAVADATADRLNDVVGFELAARPASTLVATAAISRPFQGRLLKDWLSQLEQSRVRRAFEAIQLGIVEGQTNDQIVRRIRGTRAARYTDGILEGTRRGLQALVRTSVSHVSNQARQIVYEQNADIITKLRWTATLDSRTTAICRGRDGKVYPLDSGPRPPAHINCRSVMVPVLASFDELAGPNALKGKRGARSIDRLIEKELTAQGKSAGEVQRIINGTRASMDGQVPGDLTYGDWLRRQTDAFQDDVLGKTKGKLFRDGELPVDRFVDLETGREFTIEQLRRREPKAFRKAGLPSQS